MALVSPVAATADPGVRWSGAWTTSQQHPMPGNEWLGPNWSLDGFADQSVRQVVRVSTGGPLVRIRLSNRYGAAPLRLTGASIAKAGAGAAVRPKTLRPLTFGGRLTTTIPAGAETVSDPTVLRVAALESLTVTLYFAGSTGAATFHEGGLTTTYRAAGDHRFDPGAAAFAGEASHSWYYLTGVVAVRATLTPIKGNFYDNPCDENVMCNERLRDAVNDWIRTSNEFDAVVDLDRALADPHDPDAMRPAYASPDLLHPNDAGMHAMAVAIDPKIL